MRAPQRKQLGKTLQTPLDSFTFPGWLRETDQELEHWRDVIQSLEPFTRERVGTEAYRQALERGLPPAGMAFSLLLPSSVQESSFDQTARPDERRVGLDPLLKRLWRAYGVGGGFVQRLNRDKSFQDHVLLHLGGETASTPEIVMEHLRKGGNQPIGLAALPSSLGPFTAEELGVQYEVSRFEEMN